jgi:hypothetical protein
MTLYIWDDVNATVTLTWRPERFVVCPFYNYDRQVYAPSRKKLL